MTPELLAKLGWTLFGTGIVMLLLARAFFRLPGTDFFTSALAPNPKALFTPPGLAIWGAANVLEVIGFMLILFYV